MDQEGLREQQDQTVHLDRLGQQALKVLAVNQDHRDCQVCQVHLASLEFVEPKVKMAQ